MSWGKLFALLGGLLLCWLIFRSIRSNPELFTKANLSKSFMTMGFLALGLIAFIAFGVMLLRSA